jgi:hypothetical protein
MTTSVAAHDEPPLGQNVTTGRRKTVADGRLRRNFWSAKETAELITEMMSMQKGAYFLFYFLVCNCRIRVCGVRCAVCGVRCAVCGVRCAVCGVRCAVWFLQIGVDSGNRWLNPSPAVAILIAQPNKFGDTFTRKVSRRRGSKCKCVGISQCCTSWFLRPQLARSGLARSHAYVHASPFFILYVWLLSDASFPAMLQKGALAAAGLVMENRPLTNTASQVRPCLCVSYCVCMGALSEVSCPTMLQNGGEADGGAMVSAHQLLTQYVSRADFNKLQADFNDFKQRVTGQILLQEEHEHEHDEAIGWRVHYHQNQN